MVSLSTQSLAAVVLLCLVSGSTGGYVAVSFLLYAPKITAMESELLKARIELVDTRVMYNQLNENYTRLNSAYLELNSSLSDLAREISDLRYDHDDLESMWNRITQTTRTDNVATTLLYHTDFGKASNIISISIPLDTYKWYHEVLIHPWLARGQITPAEAYITPSEPVVSSIVATVKAHTSDEEELADALLDLVQDKSHALSIRYYPTQEYKYPVETLVEVGGDCDTHAFLYATLLKAAGFKALLVFSADMTHAAVAVHLNGDPKHSATNQQLSFTVDGLKYYYAETTTYGWRVGDCPPETAGLTFSLLPI